MMKGKKVISGLLAAAGGMLMPVTAFAAEKPLSQLLEEAAFNTVLGIGTVFLMLIVIAVIIYCFRLIPMLQAKFTKSNQNVVEAPKAAVAAPSAAPAVQTDDLELVAVIAAAIAASEQIPVDSFVVRSIKRRV